MIVLSSVLSTVLSTVFALELNWDPQIRAIVVLAVAMVVLPGSIYLILGTNLGTRLGFLVAIAGFFGWMVIMGTIWAVYGIGYVGDSPSWELREVVTSQAAEDLSAAQLEEAHDLSAWTELAAACASPRAGSSAAGAGIAGSDAAIPMFGSESEYVVLDAFRKGGRGDSFFDSNVPWSHPPHYAIIQVQRAVVRMQQRRGRP